MVVIVGIGVPVFVNNEQVASGAHRGMQGAISQGTAMGTNATEGNLEIEFRL